MFSRQQYFFIVFTLVSGVFTSVFADGEPIIDAHFHTDTGKFLPRERIGGEMLQLEPQSRAEMLKESLDVMKRYNIVKAVASGPDPDVVAEWHRAAPDKFIPAMQFPSARLDRSFLNRIRELAEKGDLKVLGEIGFQYEGFAPNHPLYEVYFELAEELDVPVAIHMGPGPYDVFKMRPKYNVRNGDPLLLEDILQRYPNIRLQVMHAGWPFIDNMIAIMYTYRNVYAGIAFLNWALPESEYHHVIKRFIDAGLGKRIMFGTDPVAGAITETISLGVERINSAKFLTKEQRRDIFYNNAARFFRLDNQQ